MSSNAGAGAGVPQQLESLLAAFTNPDNETRRRAEAAWEDLKQRLPDEVCTMLENALQAGRQRGAPLKSHRYLYIGNPRFVVKQWDARALCCGPGFFRLHRGK